MLFSLLRHGGSCSSRKSLPPLGLVIGLAGYDPEWPESVAELMTRADRAMRAAKRQGKDGIALAPSAPAADEG